MALPDYTTLVAGSPKIWGDGGSPTPDFTTTFAALGTGAAREGPKCNFYNATSGVPEVLEIKLDVAMAATNTFGRGIEVYIGESDDSTAGNGNPGNLTGADASLASPNELKYQLNYVGTLLISAARTTNIQTQRFVYQPTCANIIPLMYNDCTGVLSSNSGDNRITITPYYRRIQD